MFPQCSIIKTIIMGVYLNTTDCLLFVFFWNIGISICIWITHQEQIRADRWQFVIRIIPSNQIYVKLQNIDSSHHVEDERTDIFSITQSLSFSRLYLYILFCLPWIRGRTSQLTTVLWQSHKAITISLQQFLFSS